MASFAFESCIDEVDLVDGGVGRASEDGSSSVRARVWLIGCRKGGRFDDALIAV